MRRAILIALAACGSGGSTKEPEQQRISPPVDTVVPAPPPPTLAFEVPAPADKVVSIGRGEAWACVARASGGVDCWGRMGIGRPEPTPRRIPGVSDAIAVGSDARCVLRRTGEVACLAQDRLELVTVPALAHVTLISSGVSQCFLHDDGGVSCNPDFPHRMRPITDAVALGSTRDRVCAMRRGGQVVCADANDSDGAWIPVAGLPPVRLFTMEVASSNSNACAVLETGEARCFYITAHDGPLRVDADTKLADFDLAQFANATAFSLSPQYGSHDGHPFVVDAVVGGKVVQFDLRGTHALPDLADATQLAAGCAVRAQGSVVCWGDNGGGIAGQPTTIGRYRRPPSKVLGVGNVAQVAMTDSVAWARTQDGTLFHWGEHGQGWATQVSLPAGAATAITVTEHGDICAIVAGGAVWCRNAEDTAFTRKLETGAISIAGHELGVIALRRDGSFEAITLREKESSSQSEVPKLLPAPGAVAVWSYSYRQCVLFGDGAAACFEGNEWSRVPNLRGATDVAPRHWPCANGTGSLVCWGYDIDKPLVKLEKGPAISDAVALAGGDEVLCAVRSRGRVTCYRDYGYEEQDVIAAGAIDVAVALKVSTGCAIMRDRTVQCWGTNTGGVLGDGSVIYTDRPLGVRL